MISLFFSSLITRYIYIFFLSTNPLAITGAIVARARIEHPPRQIPGTTHNTQPLPLPLSTCRQPPFQPFFSSFLHGPSDSLFFFLPVDGGVYPAHVSRGKRIYSRWTGTDAGDGLSAREQYHCASPRRSASDGTLHTKGIGQPIIFRTVFRAFDSCTTLAPFSETFGIFCSSKNSADRKLAGCVPNAIRASTTRPGRQKATVKIVFEGNTPRVLFLFDGVVESGRFLL